MIFLNQINPLNGYMPDNQGKNNPFYNKTHTKEARELMSLKRKGVSHSIQHRAAVSKAKSGVPRIDIKRGLHHKARAVVISGVKYDCVTDAAEALNVTVHTIRNRIKIHDEYSYESD